MKGKVWSWVSIDDTISTAKDAKPKVVTLYLTLAIIYQLAINQDILKSGLNYLIDKNITKIFITVRF